MDNLFAKTINVLTKEKLYLHRSQTIDNLSNILNCESCDISEALEENVSMDYDSVINFFRVEEAKKVMNCIKPNWSLPTVAKSSGFNNLSSFFRSFKEVTGETPFKYFLKNYCNNDSEELLHN